MATPMTAWMARRRHSWPAIAEMGVAMYLAFVVLFPPLWLGLLAGDVLMPRNGSGHAAPQGGIRRGALTPPPGRSASRHRVVSPVELQDDPGGTRAAAAAGARR